MKYKIMIDNEYNTEGGITESIQVEYDGITYNSRIEAWRAFWKSKDCNGKDCNMTGCKDCNMTGCNVYVKEI